MVRVIEPACVCTPLASKARIAIVRFEPAGTVMVPDATPLVTGMLKTRVVGISGALTSTTTAAIAVPETSARIATAPSAPRGSTTGWSEQDARSRRSKAARPRQAKKRCVRDMVVCSGRWRRRFDRQLSHRAQGRSFSPDLVSKPRSMRDLESDRLGAPRPSGVSVVASGHNDAVVDLFARSIAECKQLYLSPVNDLKK